MKGRWHGGVRPSAPSTSTCITYDADGGVLEWGPPNAHGVSWSLLAVCVWVKDLTKPACEAWIGEGVNDGSSTWFHFGTYFVAEFSEVQATLDRYASQGIYGHRRVIIEEWCWDDKEQWHMLNHI
jgi:hypothetical protein